jgi:tight adherence protein C
MTYFYVIQGQVWWLLAALTIPLAASSGYYLWASDRRGQAVRRQLEAFRGAIHQTQAANLCWYHRLGLWLAPIVGVVEEQRLQRTLAAAGIKARGVVATFITIKAVTALSVAGLLWLGFELRQVFETLIIVRLGIIGLGLLLGWRLPDVVVSRLVVRRRLSLEHGIPDALDLLVICAEAGLSLNQAVDEISQQMRLSNKNVADEFALTSAEMRILPDFGRALDNMVDRTGLTQLGSMVATLKQAMKYGTPLAESLRMIAVEMRAERQALMEERAARLPVLLAVPMMLFILPSLFMIVGTPVAIRIIDTFRNIQVG